MGHQMRRENAVARDEQVVREHVPRTDEKALGPDQRFDPRPILRALLEMVFDCDRLSVERERAERRLALEQVEQPGDHRYEPRAIALEALLPLAIPVRMRNDEDAPAHAAAHERDRARRGEAGDRAD